MPLVASRDSWVAAVDSRRGQSVTASTTSLMHWWSWHQLSSNFQLTTTQCEPPNRRYTRWRIFQISSEQSTELTFPSEHRQLMKTCALTERYPYNRRSSCVRRKHGAHWHSCHVAWQQPQQLYLEVEWLVPAVQSWTCPWRMASQYVSLLLTVLLLDLKIYIMQLTVKSRIQYARFSPKIEIRQPGCV